MSGSSSDPNAVQSHLEKISQSRPTGQQQLVFDPKTGKLVLAPTPSPDALIATDIAGDGFFLGA